MKKKMHVAGVVGDAIIAPRRCVTCTFYVELACWDALIFAMGKREGSTAREWYRSVPTMAWISVR
jgi:hypothetical protein